MSSSVLTLKSGKTVRNLTKAGQLVIFTADKFKNKNNNQKSNGYYIFNYTFNKPKTT